MRDKITTFEDKLEVLKKIEIDRDVLLYLKDRLIDLNIEILGKYKGKIFDLISRGKLEGWCWQTTESAIAFLDDDDYIERGYLNLSRRDSKYYHSWICFKYENNEYVFDPCFGLLSDIDSYHNILDANVLGRVTAKDIKEELIRQINNHFNSDKEREKNDFITKFFGDEYYEKRKNEVVVHGPEDVNTALYRNGAGYTTEIEDNKIKKMTVHYYYTDC